jgi:hypothetical protein
LSGIGNKYKSEILFLNNIHPFEKVTTLSEDQLYRLVMDVPRILEYGYENNGRTRKSKDKEKTYGIPHIGYLEDLENLVGYVAPKLYQKENLQQGQLFGVLIVNQSMSTNVGRYMLSLFNHVSCIISFKTIF